MDIQPQPGSAAVLAAAAHWGQSPASSTGLLEGAWRLAAAKLDSSRGAPWCQEGAAEPENVRLASGCLYVGPCHACWRVPDSWQPPCWTSHAAWPVLSATGSLPLPGEMYIALASSSSSGKLFISIHWVYPMCSSCWSAHPALCNSSACQSSIRNGGHGCPAAAWLQQRLACLHLQRCCGCVPAPGSSTSPHTSMREQARVWTP